MDESEVRKAAWLGDAVLGLWARSHILARFGRIDSALFDRMTSNQFLSGLGKPTEVEAGIADVYRERGIDGAFAYLDERVLPLFEKQLANAPIKR